MIVTGSSLCLPSPATVQELFSVARDAAIIPDISLDPILVSFLSLDSSEALQHQYKSLERSLKEEQWRTFSLRLTAQLGGSRVTYGGVGVIALALSMLFDVLAQQVRLHSVPSGSAESLRLSYKTALFRLVQSYTAYLRRNIHETEAGRSPGPQDEAASGHSQATANISSKIKVTCLGGKNSSEELDNVGPRILNDVLNATTMQNSNESSDPVLPHAAKESEGGAAARKTKVTNCSGDSRREEGNRLGLLVVEPQRNVSHNVHHHPCESSVIEQALVTRIIVAQDLQRNRYFFLNSDRVYRGLLRQRTDFDFSLL